MSYTPAKRDLSHNQLLADEMNDICKYNGMDIVSLGFSQKPSRFDIKLIDSHGVIHELFFWNADQSPINVEISWMDMRMITGPDTQLTTFGEFEESSFANGCYYIDADCGSFSITASRFLSQLGRQV